MRVLHVNEHLARKGGVETYLLALLPLLQARGVESVVAYGTGDPGEHAASHAVPAIRSQALTGGAAAERAMQQVLGDVQPDVIHVHNVQHPRIVEACLAYAPTVMTTHDYRWVCPANTFFYKRTQEVCPRTCGPGCFTTTLTKHCLTPRPQYAVFFYQRARWALQNAHRFARVIAPSDGARARYLEAGFPESQMQVLPYFCPVPPAETPRPIPERPTLTFIGRIAPNKGHEYFVEALGRLPGDVQGVMVGSITDASEAMLLELAARHGCQGRLTLHRWATRAEVQAILDQTSVFVFPSLWPETLGIVGIEAMARGVPVVASDLGGVPQWLDDGQTGYRVPPKDAAAIAAAVERLISDPERLHRFGERGIAAIRDHFMPACHADALVQIYEAVHAAADPLSSLA